MSVWRSNEYIMEYWGISSIDWQQKNRDILNEAIRVYNLYVRNRKTLTEVQDAIYCAEDRLRNECGTYMDDIEQMKRNVDEIERKREGL